LTSLEPASPRAWSDRLLFDRERVSRYQSTQVAEITEAVQRRARAAGASAAILSGSTARGRRTGVSDLDYQIVGRTPPEVRDLPEDIDLYADAPERFWAKLRDGDDFTHWSVWYGCVLFDSGIVRDAARWIAEHDAWPDPERKLRQAHHALDFAARMAESGDYGATLEQARGALSLAARWLLLSRDVFPLARDELPEQLTEVGLAELGRVLHRCIHERPSERDLREALAQARLITEAKRSGPRRLAA